MSDSNEEMNNRAKKEIVNGFVVDQSGFHLDNDKLEAAILSKVTSETSYSGDPDDSPDIEGDVEQVDGKIMDKNGFHLDKDDLLSSIASNMGLPSPAKNLAKGKSSKKYAINTSSGILQPILEDLEQIVFSENYEDEISIIRKAIKEAAKDLKVRRIISNTKLIAKNAQKFYQSENGMRTIFSILGNKFSMSAIGDFTGNEAFYLQVNGDTLDGVVLRKNELGDFSDVTSDYNVEVKKA